MEETKQYSPHPVFLWFGRAGTVMLAATLLYVLPHLTIFGALVLLILVGWLIVFMRPIDPRKSMAERLRLMAPLLPWAVAIVVLGLHATPADSFFLKGIFIALAVMYVLLLIPCVIVRLACALVQLGRKHRPEPVHSPHHLLSFSGISALVAGMAFSTATFLLLGDDKPIQRPWLTSTAPPISTPDNGFLILQGMSADFHLDEDDSVSKIADALFCNATDKDPAWGQKAADTLAHWSECLKKADLLLQSTSWKWPPLTSTWKDPGGMEDWKMDKISFARGLVALWLIRSEIRLREGNCAQAIEDVEGVIRFSDMTGHAADSGLRAACSLEWLRLALGQCDRVASSEHVCTADLVRMLQSLPPDDAIRDVFVKGIVGEYARIVPLVISETSPEGVNQDWSHGSPKKEWFVRKMILKSNRILNRFGDMTERSIESLNHYKPHASRASSDQSGVAKWYQDLDHRILDLCQDFHGTTVTMLLSLSPDPPTCPFFYWLTRLRMSRILLAVRASQIDHGRLPEGLDMLVPEYLTAIPNDPYTEKPFCYEPSVTSPRLWSPGPNCQPNGTRGLEKDDLIYDLPS